MKFEYRIETGEQSWIQSIKENIENGDEKTTVRESLTFTVMQCDVML